MGTIRILEACQEFDRLFAAGQSVSDLTGVQETQLVISGQAVFLEGSTTPIPATGLVPITSVQFRYPNGFGFQLEGPRQYLFRGEVYEGNGTGFTKVSGFVDPGSGGGGGGGGGGGDASAANQVIQTARLEAIRDRLPATVGTKASAASLAVVEAAGSAASVASTITAGGTAQTLAAANPSRRGLTLQNLSNGDLRVNPFGAASATVGFKVGPDQLLVLDAPHCGVGAVSIWGATTGQAFHGAEAA